MILPVIAIFIGTALLLWSADRFVTGAASLARNWGMSPMLIGLTVVSLGTSAPEILISFTASLVGASGIAVGNAIGSNIANIGLVLGVTALVAPLPVRSALMRKEFPILAIVTGLAGVLIFDLSLDRIDGLVLLAGLVVAMYLLVHFQPPPQAAEELASEEQEMEHLTTRRAVFWFSVGLLLLVLSSRVLVWAATDIALLLGVSDLVIGLTIVAIGTSLPELAASITSALKGHHDIAIGNVIGSNIFNLLAVMAIPGIIAPYEFAPELLWRDYGLMLTMTLLLLFLAYHGGKHGKQNTLGRGTGILFSGAYIGYLVLLYMQH